MYKDCPKCRRVNEATTEACRYCGAHWPPGPNDPPRETHRGAGTTTSDARRNSGVPTWLVISIVATVAFVAVGVTLAVSGGPRGQGSPGVTVASAPRVEARNVRSTFELRSRGTTTIDGGLWLPVVSLDLHNTGTRDLDGVYLRAIFVDGDDVLRGDPVYAGVRMLPAGYSKGPVELMGEVGFSSDLAFMRWGEGRQRLNFELAISTKPSGP